MELAFGRRAVGIFQKMVQCSSKFGDLLTIFHENNQVVLSAFNNARSAHMYFRIERNFFEDSPFSYSSNLASITLQNKSVLQVFKTIKSIDMCIIRCEDAETFHSILFELHCQKGVRKRFKLSIQDSQLRRPVVSRDMITTRVVLRPRLLLNNLQHFHSNLEEVTMVLQPEGMMLKSFVHDSKEVMEFGSRCADGRAVSAASIPVDEFDEYTMMGDDTGEFTVTVKELRAVFKFCESGNATVTVLFERMSRPIIIDAKIPEVISAEFLLATIVHNADDDYSDGSSEASSSCSSRPSKSSMEGTKATTNSALSSVTSHPPSNLFSPAVSIPGPSINSSLSAPQSGKSLAAALEEGCVMGSDDDNDDDERGENREERGEGKRKRIKLSKSSKARSKPKKPLLSAHVRTSEMGDSDADDDFA